MPSHDTWFELEKLDEIGPTTGERGRGREGQRAEAEGEGEGRLRESHRTDQDVREEAK